MFAIASLTFRLLAARWPYVVAWYLAGWLARYLLIELAATAGASSALAGLMIMPLAILARLASYIAMFLALRPAMPAFVSLYRKGDDAVDRTSTALDGRQKFVDIVLVSILPFFAFYAAWQLLAEDTAQYAGSALSKIDYFAVAPGSGGRVLGIELNGWSIAAIIVAFLGRYLIKQYSSRLPRWSSLVAVYLEAIWVYLTLFLVTTYVGGFQSWLANREAMRWLDDARQTVTGAFAPLDAAYNGLLWAINETGGLILLPLAWLTLAGVVYGRALAAPRIRYRPQGRAYTGVRNRVNALPAGVMRRVTELGGEWLSRWRPLANALLLIWRAGVVPMGTYILGYTILLAATSWLDFAAVRLIGPHDLNSWWMNFDGVLTFVVALLVEPLRVCLIVAAYDFCLRKLEERRAVADEGAAQDAAAGVATAPSAGTSATGPRH